jgi:hypothetical protein
MVKLIIQNRGWDKKNIEYIQNNLVPIVKKISKEIKLANNITLNLEPHSNDEEGDRAMYDEGNIIIYQNSPDYIGDFIHELGHQLLRLDKVSTSYKNKLKKLQKKIKESNGDGRIFLQKHTYKNEKEVFSTIFKWYILGKISDSGYTEVLNNFVPGAEELVEHAIYNEPLIKSIQTNNKRIVFFKSKQKKHKLYFDMDGVLANFNLQFELYFGMEPKKFYHKFGKQMFDEAVENAGENFWSTMKPIQEGFRLWNETGRHLDKHILSSPGGFTHAESGKLKWLSEHIPELTKNKIIIDEDKGKYADKDCILIDDHKKNTDSFEKNGGKTFLFKEGSYGKIIPFIKEKIKIKESDDNTEGDLEKIEQQGVTTFSGFKTKGKINFQGLRITIENKKGDIRRGTGEDGEKWETKMKNDYGYILGTHSNEMRDHLDCFIGNNKNSEKVYIIKQQDPHTKIYDEDKVILGVNNKKEAVDIYKNNYDSIWKLRIKKIKKTTIKELKRRAVEGKEINL